MPAEGVTILTSNQVGGIKSHATDECCEAGEHWLVKEGRYSFSTLARVTKAGIKSHATDERCEAGEHWLVNEGRYSFSTLARVTKSGIASAETIEGEATGVHLKRKGEGKGVVLTMSMAERAKETAGIPRTGGIVSMTMVLHDRNENEIYYSLTVPPMTEKMKELQVFNTARTAKDNLPRLKKYASELKKPFKLKPASKGGNKNSKSDRGAGGGDMPANLNLWLSVGEVPKGENVTELKAKRKRAEDERN